MNATPESSVPPAPEPDTKDWTWVVERPCPECGFDAGSVELEDIADRIRSNALDWEAVLDAAPELVRTRPAPTTWSASEYAAHVRDVLALYDHRLARMLAEDGPYYDNWDQDATALEERYDLQDPADILPQLQANAATIADRFDTVTGDQWDRTGHRSDGATFTIRTFGRYFLHDIVHHVDDARRGMAGLVR